MQDDFVKIGEVVFPGDISGWSPEDIEYLEQELSKAISEHYVTLMEGLLEVSAEIQKTENPMLRWNHEKSCIERMKKAK